MHTPSTSLLAFVNPALLGWLAAAAVPVVIHLLARRQYRKVTWAAMEFLAAARRKTARRLRLEQFLLLSLRTLLVAVFVLAVADPRGCRNTPMSAAALGGGRHHILLIDNTLSTRYVEGDASVAARIRETAERLLDSAPPGAADAWTVLTLARPAALETEVPLRDRSQLVAVLGRIEAGESAADPAGALRKAAEILRARDADFDAQTVYVLTDNARSAWSPGAEPDRTVAAAIRDLLQPEPSESGAAVRPAAVTVIDLGPREPLRNVAVTHITVDRLSETDPEVNRSGVPVTVAVRNTGESSADGVRVKLSARPDVQLSKIVSEPLFLKPGQTASATFAVQFAAGGSHVFTAELVADAAGSRPWDDGLADDNVRRRALPVHRKLPVLLLDGEPGDSPGRRETVFLRPTFEVGDAAAVFEPRVAAWTPQEARAADPSRWALTVLANVESPDSGFARRLRKHVWDGGAAMLFVGSRVIAGDWNERLFSPLPGADRDAEPWLVEPLLPGTLGREVPADPKGGEPFRFAYPAGRTEPHPVVAFLAGTEAEKSLETAATRQYLKLEIDPKAVGVERVLDFSTGDPAIVIRRFGRGRVALITTSADADWSAFGARPVLFVPVIRRLALDLIAPQTADLFNRTVGDPLDFEPRFGERLAQPSLERLDANAPAPVELPPDAGTGGRPVHLDRLARSGAYRLSDGGGRGPRWYFAVNPDPVESDLSRPDRAELDKLLGLEDPSAEAARSRLTLISDPAELDALLAEGAGDAGRWGRRLLWVVLAMLILETLLARWFDRRREEI